MDAELKTALGELQSVNEGFSEKLKQSDAEIKKLGAELPETKAAIEAANEALGKAMDKVKSMEEERKAEKERLDAMETMLKRSGKGMNGEDEATERKNAAEFLSAAKRRVVFASDDDVNLEEYAVYKEAFHKLAVKGFDVDADGVDKKALSVGRDPDGGYLVPAEMSTTFVQRIFETSPMRQISRVQSINSDAFEQPIDSNDATSGGWVAEKASRPTTDTPEIGEQRIPVHEQYAYPLISQKMLEDNAINIETWLLGKKDDKMGRTENTAFVAGNGVGKPRGFLDYKADAVTTDDATRKWGVLQYVATGASAGFPTISGKTASDYGPLADIIAKLNPAYRQGAVWVMNRQTEAELRKLKDDDANSLLGLNLRDGATGFQCLNFPIVTAEDVPDIAADSFSLAFGNFNQGYLIVDRLGTSVLRDPYSSKPYVGFYMRRRVGGDVSNFDAIKLMKFGTS